MDTQVHHIVGREQELDALAAFVAACAEGPGVLQLDGPPGMGKTTLWRAATDEAERAGFRVAWCRPSGSEVRLSYSAVADLLDPLLDEVLPALPAPQRRGLEVALLRVDPGERPLDQRAVAAGLLSAIRRLAHERPLMIAIDDAQWLDAPSAAALDYAARRLRTEPVAIVAATRTGPGIARPLSLDGTLAGRDPATIEVRPLSLGALHRLLRERIGQSFSRPALRRIHDTSGGNPFYALELARVAGEPPEGASGARLRVTGALADLLGGRIRVLPPACRSALFVVAASSYPTLDLITAVMDEPARATLEPAAEAGIVTVVNGNVRFAHPLLGAAAYTGGSDEARLWHARLAEQAGGLEEEAWHRALAADGPDARVATLLTRAARQARARGALASAAELYELAIARTPSGDRDQKARRTVEAAPTLMLVGERRRARDLLDTHATELPAGPLRVDALLLRAELAEDDPDGGRHERELLMQALDEVGADARRRARALLALEMLERHADRLASALSLAREALALAEQADDEILLAHALTRNADLEVLVGAAAEPVERFARAIDLDQRARIDAASGPSAMLAACLIRAGRLDEARPLLVAQQQRVLDEGDEASRDLLCLFRAELEWLSGDWDAAIAHAREGQEVAEQAGARVMWAALCVPIALVEGARGDLQAAIDHAAAAEAQCVEIGEDSYARYNRRAVGFLELSRGNLGAAVRHLSDYSVELGVEGTKRISFIGDAIEAMVRAGDAARAGGLIDEVSRRGVLLHRPPLLAFAARGRALLDGAGGRAGSVEEHLDEAARVFTGLGMRFELARTLLLLGETRRRAKRKRGARDALNAALTAFEELGAKPWAERARSELARIGGRTASGELTPTERRVAELVAAGLSNKEVAARLFVSVRAVEANLSRIYAKLEIASRTELARRF